MSVFDRIKDEILITDIADRLGIQVLRGKWALCFNHSEKKPSLYFNTQVGHRYFNKFKCYGCGIQGSGIDLIMKYNNTDKRGVAEWIKEQFNIREGSTGYTPKYKTKLKNAEKSAEQKPAEIDKGKFAEIYRAFIDSLLLVNEGSYLIAERGLSKGVLDANDIKRIPDDYNFMKHLGKFSEADLIESGLLTGKDLAFHGKGFVFYDCDYVSPFYQGDNIIYLQGVFKERENKYKNLSGRAKPLLYLPKQFKDYTGEVYITEGIIDALSFIEAGLNAVAIIDASITNNTDKLAELEVLKHLTCIICGDNELTGVKAQVVLYKYMLKNFFTVKHLDIMKLAENYQITGKIKDANDLVKAIKKKIGG